MNNLHKTLLNYSTSLTKEVAKSSSSDKSGVIEKHILDIRKKVEDSIDKDTAKIKDKKETKSYIKLGFDNLNKKIDIFEANYLAQQNYIAGLITEQLSEVNTSIKSSSSNSTEESITGVLTKLFGSSGSDVISKFSTATSILKGLGWAVTNPYIMIPLATLAASVFIATKVNKVIKESEEDVAESARSQFGVSEKDIETYWNKFSPDKTYDQWISEINDPNKSKEEREKLKKELDEIWDKITNAMKEDAKKKINPAVASQSSAEMATDPNTTTDYYNETHTLVEKIMNSLTGADKNKDYKGYLSNYDISTFGQGSASEVIADIQSSYQELSLSHINEKNSSYESSANDFKNSLKSVSYTGFNYDDPIGSLQLLCKYYVRKYSEKHNEDSKVLYKMFKDSYDRVFSYFIYPIGRDKKNPSSSQFLATDAENDWISFVKYSLSSVGINKNVPYNLYNIYYPDRYKYDKDKNHTSKMTIKQQSELLGLNNFGKHSSVEEDPDTYYFLPINVKAEKREYTINKDTRETLNKMGIALANKLKYKGENDLLPVSLGDNWNSQMNIVAEQEAIDSVRSIFNKIQIADDYKSDFIIQDILSSHGMSENIEGRNEISEILQNHSIDELDNLEKDNKEEYEKLLNIVGDKNNLDKILKLTKEFKSSSKYNVNLKDTLELYNSVLMKTNENYSAKKLTIEDFKKIIDTINSNKELRDRYRASKTSDDYVKLAKELGLEIDTFPYVTTKLIVDRLFLYAGKLQLSDEGDDDPDALISNAFGVSGMLLEDLSSTFKIPGLDDTYDNLISSGYTKDKLKEYLNTLSKNKTLGVHIKSNEETGEYETVFNNANLTKEDILTSISEGINNSSLETKTLLAEAVNTLLQGINALRSNPGATVISNDDENGGQ